MLNFFEENNIKYKKDEKLSDYSTFKIGGKAPIIVFPENEIQIHDLICFCTDKGFDYFVLGNGSNILFRETPFEKIIINLCDNFADYKIIDNKIIAKSGINLTRLCKIARDNSLSGLEFAYGIPGTLGGAVYMNAGAYDGEMKNVIKSVTFFDETGEAFKFENEKLDFSYRHSFFTNKNLIITEVELELEKGDKEKISEKMDGFLNARKEKQPLNYPSCGSTFKRPTGNYASKLIDECGLKGYTIGGAQVSEKHAGFVINRGNASYKDVVELINYIKKTVLEKTGYNLECEIEMR